MLKENPKLARHRDFTNGYTGLHWAAKHGDTDLVKLLAGTYQANVNAKSHGGYSPLHIAAQHNHQEVFDLLVQVRDLRWKITGGVITWPRVIIAWQLLPCAAPSFAWLRLSCLCVVQ